MADTYVWSKVDLPDPATYYGGFKEARVLSYGQINRALSDDRGQYEGADFSFTVSDHDRLIRGLVDDPATKYAVRNRNITIRMISDADRRLLNTPRTIARGLTKNITPQSPLQAQFDCVDFVSSKFAGTNTAAQVPQRTFAADFPGAPLEARKMAVPIIYGTVSDEASAAAPPTPDGLTAEGAYVWGEYRAGWAPMGSTAAVPTSVTLTAGAPGSGTLSADVPGGAYGVWVTAVDGAGVESDPHVYYANGPGPGIGTFAFGPTPAVGVDGTQAVNVTWAAAAGAVKYRVYLGWYYYGVTWVQHIETTGLTASFTAGANSAEARTPDNITPGAQIINFGPYYYYAIMALMADGLTAPSTYVFGHSGPYQRKIRLRWFAVPGALEYRIVRRATPPFAGGDYDRMWTVPATDLLWDDDLVDTDVTYLDGGIQSPRGAVPVVYLGPTPDDYGFPWETFAICGHAVAGVDSWFLDGVRVHPGTAGGTWLVPGHPGYLTKFAASGPGGMYRDVGGGRYALIYVCGPDGAVGAGANPGEGVPLEATGVSKITVNVRGIETVGDGSGTVITDLIQQYQHFVVNWGFQSYQTGLWLAAPTWAPDAPTLSKIDETSFARASEIAAARLPGGYVGAGIIGVNGEQDTLREWMARFNLSANVDSGFNRNSQFFISMIDHRATALDDRLEFTQLQDIVAGSFSVAPQVDRHFNIHPYSYRRRWREGSWEVENKEVIDAASIDGYLAELVAQTTELWFVRDATTAEDVMTRRLLLAKDPPVYVRFTTPLVGFNTDVGDLILLTHVDGIGMAGWVRRALRIVRHTLDPNDFSISMECLDVQRLYPGGLRLAPAADSRYTRLLPEETDYAEQSTQEGD